MASATCGLPVHVHGCCCGNHQLSSLPKHDHNTPRQYPAHSIKCALAVQVHHPIQGLTIQEVDLGKNCSSHRLCLPHEIYWILADRQQEERPTLQTAHCVPCYRRKPYTATPLAVLSLPYSLPLSHLHISSRVWPLLRPRRRRRWQQQSASSTSCSTTSPPAPHRRRSRAPSTSPATMHRLAPFHSRACLSPQLSVLAAPTPAWSVSARSLQARRAYRRSRTSCLRVNPRGRAP